jgi:hypothetical protein
MSKVSSFIATSLISVSLSIIATGVAHYLSLIQQRDIFYLIVIFLFLFFTIYFFIWKRQLNSYGIYSVDPPHSSLDMNLQMKHCQSSFDFFGVSARTILDAQGGATIKKKIVANPNVKIRFLLLDPREDIIGKQRAEDETGNCNDWVAWKKIITASIDELKTLKSEITTAKIEVRIYKETPIFRSICVDRKLMYVNYYGKGFRPSETSNLQLSNKSISLFNALEGNFDRVWDAAQVIL